MVRQKSPSFTIKMLNQSMFEIVAELIISFGSAIIGGMMTLSTVLSLPHHSPHMSKQDSDLFAAGLITAGFMLCLSGSFFTLYMARILLAKLKKEAEHDAKIALHKLFIPNNFCGNLILSIITSLFAGASATGIHFVNAAVQGTNTTNANRTMVAAVGGPITTFAILMTLFSMKPLHHRASNSVRTRFFSQTNDEESSLLVSNRVTVDSYPSLEEQQPAHAAFNHSNNDNKLA